jgi:hypothetical protein
VPLPRIWVLSKWNPTYGEDFHEIDDVCVMMAKGTYSWEIQTDRPHVNDQAARAIVLGGV